MKFGISLLPVVPLRSGPSEKDEMTTQLLFGEYVKILAKEDKWCLVEIFNDGYHGWLSCNMLTTIEEDHAMKVSGTEAKIIANTALPVSLKDSAHSFLIPAGSALYEYKPASNSFTAGYGVFYCRQQPIFHSQDNFREKVSETALKFLNIPYLWGGKNPFGIDCSGLTQVIMRIFGIKIPRDARQQVGHGSTINFISEAKPGDLAFFDNEDGEIIHTGIIIDNQQIIHASGHVRIDKIDHQGIYDSLLKRYTHRLRVIKNFSDL